MKKMLSIVVVGLMVSIAPGGVRLVMHWLVVDVVVRRRSRHVKKHRRVRRKRIRNVRRKSDNISCVYGFCC